MTSKDLRGMMVRAFDVPPDDPSWSWKTDVAIKLYTYPLTSALLEHGEFGVYFQPDELTVKLDKLDEFVALLTSRLDDVFQSLMKKLGRTECWLTVVVYGLVGGPTLVIDLSPDEPPNCRRLPDPELAATS